MTETAQRRWTLPVVLTGTFMTMLDFFIVNVAVPGTQRDLHASGAAIQLVVGGYGLVLAALLITGGRLGDLYGRRRMFLIGLAMFTLTSAVCGLAPDAGVLVGGRLLQGAAAALLTPQTLAIITTTFTGEARARAFAVYGLTLGAGGVFGQVIGGALIEANIGGAGWRSVFLVNLPVGAVALVLTPRAVPESRSEHPSRLDLPGVLLITAGLVALVLPLVLGRQQGWPAWIVAPLVSSPLLFAAFAWYEGTLLRRGGSPLIDVTALADRAYTAGLGVALVFCLGQESFFLVLSLYLQDGRGMGPLASGLVVAVIGAGFFAALIAGRPIAARWGRQALAAGAAGVCAGYLAIASAVAHVGVTGSLGWLVPGLVVAGFGMGLVLSPLTETVLARVRPEHAAAASGVLATALDVGGALGVAVIGSVYLSRTGTGPASGHAFGLALECAAVAAGCAALVVQLLPVRAQAVAMAVATNADLASAARS